MFYEQNSRFSNSQNLPLANSKESSPDKNKRHWSLKFDWWSDASIFVKYYIHYIWKLKKFKIKYIESNPGVHSLILYFSLFSNITSSSI